MMLTRFAKTGIVTGLFLAATISFAVDDARSVLFADAELARQDAVGVEAALLAPESFDRASALLEEAGEGYGKGRNPDRIRENLTDSEALFRRAETAARNAGQDLAKLIEARQAAIEADAPELDADAWRRAQKGFRQTAVYLERGFREEALRLADSTAEQFRKSELVAIKSGLLQDTRLLIRQAKKDRVQKNAPRTLAQAEELLSRAETELENNRYDMDLPRELARQANYEARHAIYLSGFIARQKKSGRTTEDTILALEEPLRKVAAAADIPAEFDTGSDPPAEKTVTYIEELQDRSHRLEQDLEERTRQVFALEEEVTQTYERLGGITEERQALAREIERQEMERQRLRDVEALFSRDQARVLRQGNEVIIRLLGLNFAVGSATIPASGSELLVSVQTAIRLFPDASLTIAGHTDSFGSDSGNFELSKRRAGSVRRYLIDNTRISAAQISAVGYGETKPVASNQTPEGRARNRRIDIVILPDRA
jgi:outer membrane protein OmpA-like peptidoglycan-associated protein